MQIGNNRKQSPKHSALMKKPLKTLFKLVRFILTKEPNPIKDKDYIAESLVFQDDIRDAKRKGDWRRLWQYRVVFVFLLLLAVYYVYLFSVSLDEIDSFIQMDFCGWLHTNKMLYLVQSGVMILAAYYLYILYFSSDTDFFVDLIRKVVLKEKSVKYHWPYHYKHKDCSQLIRGIFWRVFRYMQTMIVISDLVFLFILVTFNQFVFNNWNYFRSSLWHILQIFQFYLTCILVSFGFWLMTHCFVKLLSSVAAELFIWRIRLWQIDQEIASYNRRKIPSLSRIMETYRKILLYIFAINPAIGKGYVAFIIIEFPTSGIYWRLFFQENLNHYYRILLLTFIGYQFICLFGLHFIFAHHNSHFRDLSKQILLTSLRHRIRRSAHVRVNLFTQEMFTTKMYGITYWRFGLISMLSFAKFIWLYTRLFIKIYQ